MEQRLGGRCREGVVSPPGDPCVPAPENYAQHWCSLLTDPAGAFSPCHSVINPTPFHSVRPRPVGDPSSRGGRGLERGLPCSFPQPPFPGSLCQGPSSMEAPGEAPFPHPLLGLQGPGLWPHPQVPAASGVTGPPVPVCVRVSSPDTGHAGSGPLMTPLCSSHLQSRYLQKGHRHRPQGLPFLGGHNSTHSRWLLGSFPEAQSPQTHWGEGGGLPEDTGPPLPWGGCGLRPAPRGPPLALGQLSAAVLGFSRHLSWSRQTPPADPTPPARSARPAHRGG